MMTKPTIPEILDGIGAAAVFGLAIAAMAFAATVCI